MLKVLLSVLFGLFINMVCVSSSSIYDSIFWDPQNPLFRNKSQSCSTGYMTLKVRLHSKVFFICPNTATVLQKTLTAPQSATMYENLWIAYDRSVFDQCNTSLSNTSKLLFQCSDPTALKYFPVVFAEFTAHENSLRFKDGKKYYFIGTSDGTQTHLNDPSGGHCNDTKNGVFMKIEVYVCKRSNQTYTDEDCPEEEVGVLKCRDNPTPTTALPTTVLPTTTTTSSSSSSSLFMSSTITPTSITTQAPCTQAGSINEQNSVTESKQSTPTEPVKCPVPPRNDRQVGDNHMEREMEKWRTVAIVFLVLLLICILVIIALSALYCFHRKKKKKVRHESFEKNPKKSPALRQVSVGGVSNRGFMPSLIFNNAGDNGRTAHTPNGFPSFYGVTSEISSTGSMEVDLKKPVKDGSIVFENEDVYYDNNGKVNMYEVPNEAGTEVDGRRPSQDGSVVFESKEGHYDNIGKMNTNDVPEVDGRKPTQDGNVAFGKKEVHFAKNGQINEGLAFDV